MSGQTGAPHEIWYRYGGRELGYTGNNGTSDMAMSASISERQKVTPTNQGTFRNKQLAGTAYADFAQAYDPLNSYNQGSSSGSYTVQMGDTLQSIAQGLYGDSGLWYKIAEVNGLSAYSGLIEGQRLTLPAGVMNATHNASSFKAYDPSSTLGDVNPSTNPTPQKAKKGCGVFGTILLAVVAIAVTAVIKVPVAKFFAGLGSSIAGATGAAIGTAVGYAATGAAASMVSQSVGLATGIQDKFSWKAVGSAAVRSLFAPQSSGSFATDVINGVVNEAMYQGVATGIGLQNKFDWAGVAAAGISSGVGGQVRSGFGAAANDVAGLAQTVAVGAAEAISYAATRSALTGENFGRNIEAALPNVIASALVNGASLALRSIGNSGAAQIEADAPTSENQATTGEQVSGAIINISGARNGGSFPKLGSVVGNVSLLENEAGTILTTAGSDFGNINFLQDNGLQRRQLSPGAPIYDIATGASGSETIAFSNQMQSELISWFVTYGLEASAQDLQNTLADIQYRHSGETIQPIGNLQEVLDHYRETGTVAHGATVRSYAVSAFNQMRGDALTSVPGAIIAGALVWDEKAAAAIRREQPIAFDIGQYGGYAAGAAGIVRSLGKEAVGQAATAGSRAALDTASRANLLGAVRSTGSLSEAKGLVYAQRQGQRLGFDTVLPSLTYRGTQGIDLALQNGVTGRLAVFEAKGGFTQKSLSALSRDTQRIVQGSEDFIDTRLGRYVEFGDRANNTTARLLQTAFENRTLNSYATFYGSKRSYQLPLDGSVVRPATLIP